MALDLKDLRVKLTVEGWAAVQAEAEVSGREMSEVVRELVHRFYLERSRAAILLNQVLEREGLTGIQGERGNVTPLNRS